VFAKIKSHKLGHIPKSSWGAFKSGALGKNGLLGSLSFFKNNPSNHHDVVRKNGLWSDQIFGGQDFSPLTRNSGSKINYPAAGKPYTNQKAAGSSCKCHILPTMAVCTQFLHLFKADIVFFRPIVL